MPIIANPCNTLEALAQFQFQILKSLNKKFAALRRLAELLEQAGDLSSLLPNLGQLVPVPNLTISLYEELASNCPFLNLPSATESSLTALQSKLNAAYGLFAGQLLNHPWMRMNKVQDELNKFQQKINFPYGDDYLRCLETVCATIGVLGTTFEKTSKTNISKELTDFGENFVNNAGQVLTKSMQTKRDEAIQVYNGVLDLKSDSVQDFRSVTSSGPALGSPQQTPLSVGHPILPDFQFLPDGTLRYPSALAPLGI
jgi:hypothetical protein